MTSMLELFDTEFSVSPSSSPIDSPPDSESDFMSITNENEIFRPNSPQGDDLRKDDPLGFPFSVKLNSLNRNTSSMSLESSREPSPNFFLDLPSSRRSETVLSNMNKYELINVIQRVDRQLRIQISEAEQKEGEISSLRRSCEALKRTISKSNEVQAQLSQELEELKQERETSKATDHSKVAQLWKTIEQLDNSNIQLSKQVRQLKQAASTPSIDIKLSRTIGWKKKLEQDKTARDKADQRVAQEKIKLKAGKKKEEKLNAWMDNRSRKGSKKRTNKRFSDLVGVQNQVKVENKFQWRKAKRSGQRS